MHFELNGWKRSARRINFTACSFSNRVRVKWMSARKRRMEMKCIGASLWASYQGGWREKLWRVAGWWAIKWYGGWFSQSCYDRSVASNNKTFSQGVQGSRSHSSLSLYLLLTHCWCTYKQGLAFINYLFQCHHVTRNWLKTKLSTRVSMYFHHIKNVSVGGETFRSIKIIFISRVFAAGQNSSVSCQI